MTATTEGGQASLHRSIDWKGAFWVASGVPALVLFSIGGIAGTVGNVAFAVWAASMMMGFIQSFTYAEIAGMFGRNGLPDLPRAVLHDVRRRDIWRRWLRREEEIGPRLGLMFRRRACGEASVAVRWSFA